MSVEVKIKKQLGKFRLDVAFSTGNDVLALLGGSGCGKSITLRCIAGIVKPDAGRIVVDGVNKLKNDMEIKPITPEQAAKNVEQQKQALKDGKMPGQN